MTGGYCSAAVEKLRIVVLMDNYYDGLLLSGNNVTRNGFIRGGGGDQKLPPNIMAEHGFSCYIEVVVEGVKHSLIMDFGVSREGVGKNIRAMELDITGVDALVLSHGHFDHFGGLINIAGQVLSGDKRVLSLFTGQDAFLHRYIALPGMKVDLGRLGKEEVESLGLEIKTVDSPVEILPGVTAIGPVPRVTSFEQGVPVLMVESGESLKQDTFPGEISLAFKLTGGGLVVLSACAHAGIINTVLRAKEITGEDRVRAILGGFHLSGAPAEKIDATVEGLVQFNPEMIVPMHCTGFQALKAISDKLPGAFIHYSVGTEYSFGDR